MVYSKGQCYKVYQFIFCPQIPWSFNTQTSSVISRCQLYANKIKCIFIKELVHSCFKKCFTFEIKKSLHETHMNESDLKGSKEKPIDFQLNRKITEREPPTQRLITKLKRFSLPYSFSFYHSHLVTVRLWRRYIAPIVQTPSTAAFQPGITK